MESHRCSPIVFGVNLDCYFNRPRAVLVDERPRSRMKVGLRLNQILEPLLLGVTATFNSRTIACSPTFSYAWTYRVPTCRKCRETARLIP